MQRPINSWCVEVKHDEFYRLMIDYKYCFKDSYKNQLMVFRIFITFLIMCFMIGLCCILPISHFDFMVIVGLSFVFCIICFSCASSFDDKNMDELDNLKVHKIYHIPDKQPFNQYFFMYQGHFFVSKSILNFINDNQNKCLLNKNRIDLEKKRREYGEKYK